MHPYPNPTLEGTPWAQVPQEDFLDWGWQFKNRIADQDSAARWFQLSATEKEGIERTRGVFRFGLTPYYALLADPLDERCPMRLQMIPRPQEATVRLGERADPLGEEEREVVPNLVHRYPDRVLLLSTDRCPVYCRFCTRRRIVGRFEKQSSRPLLAEAFEYIRQHPQIKEVIVSGGDALMLGDNQLDYILRECRAIEHIELIRIATRMPVTCPMRITDALCTVLRRYQPVYIMTHFNHPKECTVLAAQACARLVDAGLPVHNQSVLLRGVNDDASIIEALNRRLVSMRVAPYYLHQCDLAEGIEHFRTPLATGVGIVDALRGHVSGLMVPKLCVDVPGGLGKVTVQPDWIVRQNGRITTFRTYTGATADYVDPEPLGAEVHTRS